ncbi:MAG: hypothetical protein RBS48_03190 [Ignavibacteriaceae bacterium]|nr:hypothetical protein [Ignavibacteriaceae bacterium]
MRLIKENTSKFASYTQSLQYYTKGNDSGDLRVITFDQFKTKNNLFEKYELYFENISSFQKEILKSKSIVEINTLLGQYITKILGASEAELFLLDEGNQNIIPASSKCTSHHKGLVQKAFTGGMLDWIFETGKPTLIPDLKTVTKNGTKLFQIIFPIQSNYFNGILSILDSSLKYSDNSFECKSIQMALGMIIPTLASIQQRKTIETLYNDLHIYQSKLNNNFRLYAAGEYADGITKEMLDSLQIILSSVEYIENEYAEVDSEIIGQVKKRVKYLSECSQRFLKFNEVTENSSKGNLPSNINSIVNEFYSVMLPTLKDHQLECELDLEDGMPPLLTDAKQIKQVLTNIFSLIKNHTKSGSGIFIQSKYLNESIQLSFFITEYWSDFNEKMDYKSNLTVKIINELMQKSEGRADFNSLQENGTSIRLTYPLKRSLKL